MILGEVGGIHRFLSPSKLLAYAGRVPSVYQSGNFQAKKDENIRVDQDYFDMHLCAQFAMS